MTNKQDPESVGQLELDLVFTVASMPKVEIVHGIGMDEQRCYWEDCEKCKGASEASARNLVTR